MNECLKWENGKEWGEIQCPMLNNEYVMTYYPDDRSCYYSYTAPMVDDDGDVYYYRFDHDEGMWNEETFYIGEYEDGIKVQFG